MSDMKTDVAAFTVRDLNRQPAKVLSICDEEGEVEIHSRAGRKYSLKAIEEDSSGVIQLPDFQSHYKRLNRSGLQPIEDAEEIARLDNIIAGEE